MYFTTLNKGHIPFGEFIMEVKQTLWGEKHSVFPNVHVKTP